VTGVTLKRKQNRTFRIAWICLLSILAVPLLTRSVIGVLQFRAARRAETLLDEVRSLRIGESGIVDVRKIVERYQGVGDESSTPFCDQRDFSYHVMVANYFLNDLGTRYPGLRFALRPRGVLAIFMVKEGKLCYLQYSVGTFPGNIPWELSMRATISSQAKGKAGQVESSPYRTRYRSGNVWIFDVEASSEATSEQLQHALDFDLSCLSRFGGCGGACEVMPSAWRDYKERAREEGIPLPPYELDDPRCRDSSKPGPD
jgi:hypothetical protein